VASEGAVVPRVFRVLLFSLISTCCLGGSIIYLRVQRGVLEERLRGAPETGVERLRKLRAQFQAAGCASNGLYDEAVPEQDLPNLICKLPGKEPGTIIIGAPLDMAPGGSLGDTQWATLALLPLLAESVGSVPHRFSLSFVAFSGQQHRFRGSSEYV
jgi:hypothetical protein